MEMSLSISAPEPFRQNLISHLVEQSHTVLADPGASADPDHALDKHADGMVDAHVVFCDGPDNWRFVAELAPSVPTVAVIDVFELDHYVRALALGAGVVHSGAPPETITSVIAATINGEALVPLPITTVMARHEPPTNKQMTLQPLTPIEEFIAKALLDGNTNSQIADATSYSDRTVRRRLQGIYLKLGVSSRSAAVAKLRDRSGAD